MKSFKLFGLASCAVTALIAFGCAAHPPRELRDAREAFAQASRDPGAGWAQTEMQDAKRALNAAERAFDTHGDEPNVRDLAYIAQRKAVSARAKGDAMIAVHQKEMAERELEQIEQQQMARRQLDATKRQLQEQIESERRARAQVEEKLAKIEGMKEARDARGLVLTIPGEVLFAPGKSVLLPGSQAQLDKVVEAVKQDPRNIAVVGHSDVKGKPEAKMTLSQQRADAVKNYLVTHGIPAEKVQARGVGDAEPLSEDQTPRGRALNRRVELILIEGGMRPTPEPGMLPPPSGVEEPSKLPPEVEPLAPPKEGPRKPAPKKEAPTPDVPKEEPPTDGVPRP